MAHTIPKSTATVAREIGVNYFTVYNLVRFGRLETPPIRNESGDYVWFPEHIAEARKFLAALADRRSGKRIQNRQGGREASHVN